jgi:hypothetical protein
MLEDELIDKCLCLMKYNDLEAYVSDLLKDDLPLLIEFETKVWVRIRALDLEQTVVEYASWDPYVKDYVIEPIEEFKSVKDCLISILRIIYYMKGNFNYSWIKI